MEGDTEFMSPSMAYWRSLDALVSTNGFTVERAKDTPHPRYPDYIYPFDYGFIPGTKSSDGAEIDAWKGSLDNNIVTGIATTFDPIKKDMEVKVLVACSEEDKQKILAAHNRGDMKAIIIDRQGESRT